MISIGIKSDPIEYRYSYPWLFDLMAELEIKYLQLGSFFELYSLDDQYFVDLKEQAAIRGIEIKSLFTAHRELGGFFTGNPYMEQVARKNFEKLIHVASIVGANYCGSNPGAVYRDQIHFKPEGISCYLQHMQELMTLAKSKGLRALNMEPMSCLAEPPTTPEEMDFMIRSLWAYHDLHKGDTVPVYLCGDISHGMADEHFQIKYSNLELFEHGIPMMSEFHFKNTDQHFNSTFGFSTDETKKGIVNLEEIKNLLHNHTFPVDDVVGYLEIGGPKTGRDYSDPLLKGMIKESITTIKNVFESAAITI